MMRLSIRRQHVADVQVWHLEEVAQVLLEFDPVQPPHRSPARRGLGRRVSGLQGTAQSAEERRAIISRDGIRFRRHFAFFDAVKNLNPPFHQCRIAQV